MADRILNRRHFLKSVGIAAGLPLAMRPSSARESTAHQPNILIIHVDQHRMDCLGACLYEDTLIVYTADHGEFMGFHHMLLKGNYMYDPLVKVPLIVKWPGRERAGTVSQRMVSNIDLAPTLCRAADCRPAPQMDGCALQDPGAGHDLIFAEADGGRQVMVRSGERKLILSDSRSESLFFDLQKDPMEMNNLHASPEHRDEVREMTAAASAWRSKDSKPRAYQDEDAPQIQQPNVPSHDLSHRDAIIQYYREKMLARQGHTAT